MAPGKKHTPGGVLLDKEDISLLKFQNDDLIPYWGAVLGSISVQLAGATPSK